MQIHADFGLFSADGFGTESTCPTQNTIHHGGYERRLCEHSLLLGVVESSLGISEIYFLLLVLLGY